MGLFRKTPSPHQTALAMIGAKAGDRVLLAGRPDPVVVAEMARVTGLTGQTLVAVEATATGPYEAAAAEAGVLVEFIVATAASRLPATGGEHDAVVLHFDLIPLDDPARTLLVAEAFAAVRHGGRVVLVDGRRQTGWFTRPPATTLGADAVLALLGRAGGQAVRPLGESEGVSYYEARKPR